MKVLWILLLVILLTLGVTRPAEAHQPRIVTGQGMEIKKPQTSQAFYGILQGEPAEYWIREEEDFHLHVSLLIPDLPDARRDFRVEVYHREAEGRLGLLQQLEGAGHDWKPFFEPFAGDRYYQGPEFDGRVPAGDYRILVLNPDNRGKYVLSVGREESFSLQEAVETIRRLPAVKEFFEKSPFTAYFNLMGLFMLLALALAAVLAFGAYRLITYFR